MAADNRVEVLLQGKDSTGTAFTSAAAQAKAFQAAMDSANRSLDKSSVASRGAADAALRAETAFTKAQRAERFMDDEAARASKIQADLATVLGGGSLAAEDVAKSSMSAGAGLGGMVTPMTAAIAAGVALSPVIVTLGAGLGGLGLAAYGVIKPIEAAAQKTGGLKANMASLDPEQRAAARSILGLQASYDQFQRSLKPVVLQDLNAALGAARPLLRGLEPVAQATGRALGGVFTQLGAEFRSSEWKSFFTWMAQNAGPDIQLVGDSVINLTRTLPPLLEDLQPVATGLLQVTDAATKLAAASAAISRPGERWGLSGLRTVTAAAAAFPALSGAVLSLGTATAGPLSSGMKAAEGSAGSLTAALAAQATTARGAAQAAKTDAAALAAQTQAFIKGLSPLNNYVDATLASRNAEAALKTALQASGDRIGYKTQKQRDSFGAAQSYIKSLEDEASKALASGQGARRAAADIASGLGTLDAAKGKTAGYNAELSALRRLLAQLRAEKAITDLVTVVHRDVYTSGGKTYQQFHAAGGITGAAGGGPRGGLTWVGEQGPELVRLPPGSMVHPAGQSQAMAAAASGGAQRITLEVTGGHSDFERFMGAFIRKYVKVRGGNVQAVLGWGA